AESYIQLAGGDSRWNTATLLQYLTESQMALPRITSPHSTGNNRTQRVMLLVLAATLPGVVVLTWLYGAGTLINIAWASAVALGCEALLLKMRNRPVQFFLRDGSALLTAVLLALALPPYSSWWLTLIATAS